MNEKGPSTTVPDAFPERVLDALLPVERMSLTIALAQVRRGEEPTPNVASCSVLALARIAGLHDWTDDDKDEEHAHA